eukprot:1361295-Alexandrium_andersonii.AAC.1
MPQRGNGAATPNLPLSRLVVAHWAMERVEGHACAGGPPEANPNPLGGGPPAAQSAYPQPAQLAIPSCAGA